ncbi:MAG: tetratricopeptide repeat protein, partial [Verrucomicrobiae bacterium]|nr:tetratricopeptide repeat protein [Verrucomicrobiae bacterium]
MTILAFLSLTVLAQAQTEVREKALASSAASDAEIVRRQELVIRAQLLIREGETLLSRRDYSDAIVRFEEARSLLPSGPATSADANRVAVGLSTAYYRQGQDLYERGDLAAAHASLEKAVEADPKNEAAASLARKVAEKYEDQRRDKAATAAQTPAVVADPEFQKKRDRALELFYLGEDYFKSGQYDEAEKALREVLKIDPYSATAYHRLREVQREKLAKYNAMKSQTEMQAAMQVAERWTTTARVYHGTTGVTDQGETPINESGRADILRKLQNIKIKRIEFENATIASAIKFLAEESRRADPGPEPKGVNIV